MNNISEHITYDEAIKSITAIRNGISNTPNKIQLTNMKILAENVFEPLRKGLGDRVIRVASFFRCKKLNELVGGAAKSQHMALFGAAMDIDNDGFKPTNTEIFNFILKKIVFDQLIWEYGDENNPSWIHVSFNKDGNRKQVLRCVNGKYINYEA